MTTPFRRTAPLLILGLAAACAPGTTAGPAPAPAPGTITVEAPSAANAKGRHLEVHWVRSSAEYRALALQVFRDAGDRIRELAPGLEAGSWAVILDADETVLDNSEFERRIAETGQTFEESLWDAWVLEEAAGAVPGAAGFIGLVQELGGRVALVTNRDDRLCPATRRNLEALGIRPMAVLCETETGEKEPRFRMVEDGTAAEGVGPLEVVMWLGDNIGDFPGLEQALRDAPEAAFAEFGRRYFVVPNPMYGSWMGNDWR